MKFWHLFAMVAVGIAALIAAGCECDPESDEQLCGDEHCGETSLVDRCGDARNVDCGGCSQGETCEGDRCVCEPESINELCSGAEADCGAVEVTDRCGEDRQIFCGNCSEPDICNDNQCVCRGEQDDELCERHGFDCGTTTLEDTCGDERRVDCGDCFSPDECRDNVCECVGESDSQLCSDFGLECGSASVEDVCGEDRDIDCGSCGDHEECSDNACECVGESDSQLCDEVVGACGTVEATDRCGDERTIDCPDCPTGDTTFGAVRDGEDGALIDDAEINIYQWPPPERTSPDWRWPAGYRQNDPDLSTTTSAGDGDFNYEFASDEPICTDDQIDRLEPYQWYRIVVEHPDYHPGIFYRRHPGYDTDDCPDTCLAGDDTHCVRQDFELFETDSDYARFPNLIADPRQLGNRRFQCARMPDESDYDRLIGLRVTIGGINLGPGPFHLEGDADTDQVVQYVHRTDGEIVTYDIDSQFYDHDSHGHIHFMNWFRVALVDDRDECRDVDDRPDDCLTHGSDKISFCLHDSDPVDGAITEYYDGDSPMFPYDPTCDTSEQGLTPGWLDVYPLHLPGQAVILGEPDDLAATGSQLIETEVDPDRVLREVERWGNVAHSRIEIPEDGDDICADSRRVIDCSRPDPPRECTDYLDFAGVD